MRTRTSFLLCFVFLTFINGLNAQSGLSVNSAIPYKSGNSVLFGKDIIINDQPLQDQRSISICSAFNGWLFAFYTYIDSINNMPMGTIMKSQDHGITWVVLRDFIKAPSTTHFHSLSIIALGNSLDSLKLITTWVQSYGQFSGELFCYRFNGITGNYEASLLKDLGVYNTAMASDYPFAATNSFPNSIGILYSKQVANQDSLIYCSSSNGGITFDSKEYLPVKMPRLGKLDLSYGRSSTLLSGRYYAVWEEHDNNNLTFGHIYTAYTDPYFNSPFSQPVNLDSLDNSAINNCKNPSITCQNSNYDNNNGNISEIILFEKNDPVNQINNILGYYNLNSASFNQFSSLQFTNITHNNIQPSACFNTYDSTFRITYFDSSELKIPLLQNDFNVLNPNNWQVLSTGFEDSTNILKPHPKIAVDVIQHTTLCVWTAEGDQGNGKAMFDAENSVYTRIDNNNTHQKIELCTIYPNPADDFVKISFELKKPGKVIISVNNLFGQSLDVVTDQFFTSGKHEVRIDVSEIPSGSYIYTFRAGDYSIAGKLIVVR